MFLFFFLNRFEKRGRKRAKEILPTVLSFISFSSVSLQELTAWHQLLALPIAAFPSGDSSLLLVFFSLINLASEVEGQACKLRRPFSFGTADVTAVGSCLWVHGSIPPLPVLQRLYCHFAFVLLCNLKQITFAAAQNFSPWLRTLSLACWLTGRENMLITFMKKQRRPISPHFHWIPTAEADNRISIILGGLFLLLFVPLKNNLFLQRKK